MHAGRYYTLLSNGEPVNPTGCALSTNDDFIPELGTSEGPDEVPSPAAFVLISSADALQYREKMNN